MRWRGALPWAVLLFVVGAILLSLQAGMMPISRTLSGDEAARSPFSMREADARLRGTGDRLTAGTGLPSPPEDPGRLAAAGQGRERGGADWPLLRVETVDGLTGRHVSATWSLPLGRGAWVDISTFFPENEEVARAPGEWERAVRARWESQFVETGQARPLDPNGPRELALVVRPASGYVLENPAPRASAQVAAGVEQAIALVPVWPEAILDMHVVDPDGRTAEGVRLDAIEIAGRRRDDLVALCESPAPGHLRVRGVPRLPGEAVSAVLVWGTDADAPDVEHDVVEDVSEVLEDAQVVTRIPSDANQAWRVDVRLVGPRGPADDSLEVDNDLEFEESLGEGDVADIEAAPASLLVHVLDWDGVPIPYVSVNDEQADASGRILFANLKPGQHTFALRAWRHLPSRRNVTLAAGEDTEIDLREPVGARVEVRVTDEDGHPRPSAHLKVRGRVVLDVVDGVQRLDLFTDALGRRTLQRVEPGRTTIRAQWGGRHGERTVELRDGETTVVHIIAK